MLLIKCMASGKSQLIECVSKPCSHQGKSSCWKRPKSFHLPSDGSFRSLIYLWMVDAALSASRWVGWGSVAMPSSILSLPLISIFTWALIASITTHFSSAEEILSLCDSFKVNASFWVLIFFRKLVKTILKRFWSHCHSEGLFTVKCIKWLVFNLLNSH